LKLYDLTSFDSPKSVRSVGESNRGELLPPTQFVTFSD
jgi:hypothetical protein